MNGTRLRCSSVAIALILIGIAIPASGITPLACFASGGVTPIARVEGLAEPVGDVILSCTGGISTPVGQPVPQMNFTIFLNTNVTSKVTAGSPAGGFSEAMLLVDEPNSAAFGAPNPLLNCGA